MMGILRDKGFLTSTRDGRTDLYRPTVSREQVGGNVFRAVLNRFFSGFARARVLTIECAGATLLAVASLATLGGDAAAQVRQEDMPQLLKGLQRISRGNAVAAAPLANVYFSGQTTFEQHAVEGKSIPASQQIPLYTSKFTYARKGVKQRWEQTNLRKSETSQSTAVTTGDETVSLATNVLRLYANNEQDALWRNISLPFSQFMGLDGSDNMANVSSAMNWLSAKLQKGDFDYQESLFTKESLQIPRSIAIEYHRSTPAGEAAPPSPASVSRAQSGTAEITRNVTGLLLTSIHEKTKTDWTWVTCYLTPVDDEAPPILILNPQGDGWYGWSWRESDAGKWYRKARRKVPATIKRLDNSWQATFEINNVKPGPYLFEAVIREPDSPGHRGRQIASEKAEITVTEHGDGKGGQGESFYAGAFEFFFQTVLDIGSEMPDFRAKEFDGKAFRLSDYRGRFVLLNFWASWCAPCRTEMINLMATYDKYNAHPKFCMIGLNYDEDREAARKYIKENQLKWLQAIPPKKMPCEYDGGLPTVFLINPEGKLIGDQLRGERILEAVKEALGP